MPELNRGDTAQLSAPDGHVSIRVTGSAFIRGTVHIDLSAFVVTAAGAVLDEDHFVFYGNPASPDGTVSWQEVQPGTSLLRVSLGSLPPVADGVVVAGTIYGAEEHGTYLADLRGLRAEIDDGSGALMTHQLPPLPPGTRFDGVIMLSVFRRSGGWCVRAGGPPVDTGLSGIATTFGVAVE